jgi:8-oxo-dGTP pyrophosphatase MutT (NUDIX family)
VIAAASLILVRERTDGLPLFLMVERSAAMAFAPGAFVFPGGRVDPGDEGVPGCDAARVAAVREAIEEVAVAAGLESNPDRQTLLSLQRELLAGNGFAALLAAHELTLNPDTLVPFARWLPGPEVSRRFDTSFFIARAPAQCEPSLAGGECVSARWVSATKMLAEDQAGTSRLIYPTRKMLERLAKHCDLPSILEEARGLPEVTITPTIESGSDGDFISIPEGLGYPVTRDPLDRIRRG